MSQEDLLYHVVLKKGGDPLDVDWSKTRLGQFFCALTSISEQGNPIVSVRVSKSSIPSFLELIERLQRKEEVEIHSLVCRGVCH